MVEEEEEEEEGPGTPASPVARDRPTFNRPSFATLGPFRAVIKQFLQLFLVSSSYIFFSIFVVSCLRFTDLMTD